MVKKHFIIIIALALCACYSNTHKLDLGKFTIDVPKQWVFKPEQGIDSFVGFIKGPNVSLGFDCSSMGYANHLLQTEQEYLKRREWDRGYFYEPNVTYSSDVHAERMRQMKEKKITDSTLIKVEADPYYETKQQIHRPDQKEKTKYPNADYIAVLTYRGKTVNVPIELPEEIKAHHIQLDSDAHYVYKTIWPKVTGKGMTGIYIHSRSSDFNFQMEGQNLSTQDQAMALQAFKTIKFKK